MTYNLNLWIKGRETEISKNRYITFLLLTQTIVDKYQESEKKA
jgi:hypothetical protein